MPKYVLINANYGYISGVISADSANEACIICDKQLGKKNINVYTQKPLEELNILEKNVEAYDVRIAPEELTISNIRTKKDMIAVNRLPSVGFFIKNT